MINIENKIRIYFKDKYIEIDIDRNLAKEIDESNIFTSNKAVINICYNGNIYYFLLYNQLIDYYKTTFLFKSILLDELPRTFLAIFINDNRVLNFLKENVI